MLGSLVVLAGWMFNHMHDISLVDLMLQFGTLVALPYVMPLVLGFWWNRTPPWSGWSTVLVCFIASMLVTKYLTPDWAETALGLSALADSERSYWMVSVGVLTNAVVGTAWFAGSTLFWSRVPAATRERIVNCERRSREPIAVETEIGGETDDGPSQGRLLGNLSIAYGLFILALAFIPNSLGGRAGFVFCGLLVLAIGRLLRGRKRRVSDSSPSRS
ncbi:MAG: hypothetical protein J6386_03065 [Candidatus Synoicihabitans palmerolidicus]|nr:hypothetical protein [Candidatus Synoicihabitans palmerolidicus]